MESLHTPNDILFQVSRYWTLRIEPNLQPHQFLNILVHLDKLQPRFFDRSDQPNIHCLLRGSWNRKHFCLCHPVLFAVLLAARTSNKINLSNFSFIKNSLLNYETKTGVNLYFNCTAAYQL